MKILLVSTFDQRGGAAVAVKRLYKALKNESIDVSVLTFFESSYQEDYIPLSKYFWKKLGFWINFYTERLKVFFTVRKKEFLFKYSFGRFGLNICEMKQVLEADVIHFHWVSFGLISINSITKLSTQKPVIWTIHDFWPFTGGCHLPFHCLEFQRSCQSCHYLNGKSNVSNKNWRYKQKILGKSNIHFGTVSQWQLKQVNSSSILKEAKSFYLGNPLDLNTYKPHAKQRDDLLRSKGLEPTKFYIAFGAPKLTDDAKGVKFLIDAITLSNELQIPIHLLIFGESGTENLDQLRHDKTLLGRIESENQMVDIYQTADCFLQTSLQETLSYTVMESMACGTPVVAFDSGGVTDMIEHGKNGYLTELRNIQGLVDGFKFIKERNDRQAMGIDARAKILSLFDQKIIAQRHQNIYQKVMNSDFHSE